MRLSPRLRHAFLAAALLLAGCAGAIREQLYEANETPIVIGDWVKSHPQELRVATADGLSLQGFYWSGAPGDHDIVVFFHGRGANQGVASKYAEYLTGHGDGVLVASYRGFGGNPGTPSEDGLIADGRAFVAKARALAGPGAHVFLVGHSLGGAVALQVGLREPVAGVVTLSAFAELEDATPLYAKLLLPDDWDNLGAVRRLQAPLVLVHGSADTVVSASQGTKLFVAAHHPAALVMIQGATHKPSMGKLGPLITNAVAQIDADMLATFPAPLPSGWTVQHK